MEQARKFAQPMHALDAADCARFIFRQLVPFPRFEFGRGVADEQQLALLLIVRIGIEQAGWFALARCR